MDLPNFSKRTHIGIDESGKGDFFGPLVISGVHVAPRHYTALERLGVRDSKSLSSTKIVSLVSSIRNLLGAEAFETILIGPRRYNELHAKLGSVNKVLAWGHSRALENLLSRFPSCKIAVSDQFASEDVLKSTLFEMGSRIRLVQAPRGERDMAVASASIMARWGFTEAIARMERQLGSHVPLGSGAAVDVAAKDIVFKHGAAILSEISKVHFRNLERIVDRPDIVRSLVEPR